MIYSWLVYRYFYSVRRTKKKLYGFSITFDTNMLVYLLGINGRERKNYVDYLLSKMQQNNCTVRVNEFTFHELRELIRTEPNVSIKMFNRNEPKTREQVYYNTKDYFTQLLKGYSLALEYQAPKALSKESGYYRDLLSSLKEYKSLKRPVLSDDSLFHDIMLVHSANTLHKINNIYDEKRLTATCDGVLANWLSGYLSREFNSDYSLALTLEKINLIFWIESDKARASDFLGNTWMFVSESIPYFTKYPVDEFFKHVKQQYESKMIYPVNWRSPYVLVRSRIGSGTSVEDITEDQLEAALDGINAEAIEANIQMAHEIDSLKKEIASLKEKPVSFVTVNIAQPSAPKSIEEMSIFEVMVFIIKKLFRILKKLF